MTEIEPANRRNKIMAPAMVDKIAGTEATEEYLCASSIFHRVLLNFRPLS